MKIGIIAPIGFLEKYCITDVQYVLPRLLVEEPKYRNFYIKRKEKGDTIILDCRTLGWKRTPESFTFIEKALGLISPDIIVAPSYMFNSKLSKEILEKFTKELPIKKGKVLKCMEGTSEKDITKGKDPYYAIPSHMYRFLDNLPLKALHIENHLDPEELKGRKGTLVTSLPIRLGFQGRLLSDFKPAPESLTFYEEKDLYPKITLKNIEDIIEFYEEEK